MIALFLTCADEEEAEKISAVLLKKKLVVCIKKVKVKSSFLFKKKIDKADEVLLIMDSIEEKFSEIEKEVRKIHSYETFVLLATSVIKSSKGVREWIKDELK
ncbi:hypothetical protein A3A46_01180 [Candidatus Roizmanbacteria bacterium RIFCSPLOWO2_01_FULL_37_13]|uniref:CutA1 divalent ion tolerance protein n=1 Tax=Candidatus Roizmanbacteria bacterium RIFCSPHIGHO2_02_FULL_38_11 TaxID=1802039 RepID=A0A1F7GVQ5_9BACT|nr:MAG: hypothetical protein A3C25_03835 [Candidatus Roizmanbacteria bacterium RIFCSPHIGHO2_02_FULL_38_11]OGK41553.1 MAG: hypothetical protein A3A46_01180 [Candidatus Roizmanbacteria bacterium RIFCSPLOWO2_01_FULL_37_13]